MRYTVTCNKNHEVVVAVALCSIKVYFYLKKKWVSQAIKRKSGIQSRNHVTQFNEEIQIGLLQRSVKQKNIKLRGFITFNMFRKVSLQLKLPSKMTRNGKHCDYSIRK